MRLDKKLQQQITTENYKKIFNDLIKSKTDKLTNDVRLAMGVDGNDYENILRRRRVSQARRSKQSDQSR